jgi:Saxitoxin biosynthesis operon protein SxtJ
VGGARAAAFTGASGPARPSVEARIKKAGAELVRHKGPENPERSFGVSVGIVLCAVAAVFVWREHVVRGQVAGGIGILLLVSGLLYPRLLRVPSAVWWRFSRALGHFNARVLLTLIFSLVFVPISIVWRVTGKDPLARRRDRWPGWSPYPARYRDRHHYRRMF